MIKVNLLRDQTVKARRPAMAPEVSRTGLMITAGFLLLAGGLGGTWYYLDRDITNLVARGQELDRQSKELDDLRKQVDDYAKKKKLRQSRIEIIEKLKELQTGPVLLLNNVIHAVPREGSIWLTLLDQKGDTVRVGGFAARPEALPGFISTLARSGFFKSVDLEDVTEEKDAASFRLVCLLARKKATE